MIGQTFRTFSLVAAAVAAWVFTLPAQAAYDIGWDPAFAGDVVIDWIPGTGCPIAPSTDVHCTTIKVLSVDFDDNAPEPPGEWTSSPLQTGLPGDLFFDSSGHLIGVDSLTIGNLKNTGTSADDGSSGDPIFPNPCGEGTPTLGFSFDGETESVTFNCGGPTAPRSGVSSNVTITAVPEPATLALLGLGLSGLALSRRRKLS